MAASKMERFRKQYLRVGLPLLLAMIGLTAAWNVRGRMSAGPAAEGTVARDTCTATPVHYAQNPLAGSGLTDLPWVAAGHGRSAIVGYLFYYPSVLADHRFNQSPEFVIPTGADIPNASTKILWIAQGDSGRMLAVDGRRLDQAGSFNQREAAAGPGFPSIIDIPAPGCWRLTLKTGSLVGSLVVKAVNVGVINCEATPVRRQPNPQLGGNGPSISATPASARISARGSVVVGRRDEASVYAGGRAPDGGKQRLIWVVQRGSGRLLEITAGRLDGPGWFKQKRRSGRRKGTFQSTLSVSPPGCWLLTLRRGRAAGIFVFRVLPR